MWPWWVGARSAKGNSADRMLPAIGRGTSLYGFAIMLTADPAHLYGENSTPARVPLHPGVRMLQLTERRDHFVPVLVS